MSDAYDLMKAATKVHEAYKALSWHVIETEKRLVGLEIDRDEAAEQRDYGMAATLSGECKRIQTYLHGLKTAEGMFNE